MRSHLAMVNLKAWVMTTAPRWKRSQKNIEKHRKITAVFVWKFTVIKALIIPLNKPLLMPLRLKNELAPLLRPYDATLCDRLTNQNFPHVRVYATSLTLQELLLPIKPITSISWSRRLSSICSSAHGALHSSICRPPIMMSILMTISTMSSANLTLVKRRLCLTTPI